MKMNNKYVKSISRNADKEVNCVKPKSPLILVYLFQIISLQSFDLILHNTSIQSSVCCNLFFNVESRTIQTTVKCQSEAE